MSVVPAVSVVVPTHDRPSCLFRLLTAIKAQDFAPFEVLVADDCSSDATLAQYDAFWPSLDERFRLVRVPPSVSRKAPGVTRNHGASNARGAFVAFCDDDDLWVRNDHLRVAVEALRSQNADLFIANMQTSEDGRVDNPNWYGNQVAYFSGKFRPVAGSEDIYVVPPGEKHRFLTGRTPHADTLVMAKPLFDAIGGYWDKVAFGEDHDFAYRLFDRARCIVFRTAVTGDLDVSPHASVARRYEFEERCLFGILVCLHAERAVADPKLRRQLRRDRAWRLLELAQHHAEAGHRGRAVAFVTESLKIAPTGTALKLLLGLMAGKQASERSRP
jgi:glycosyltransferase involved in cell wall biosynthesis